MKYILTSILLLMSVHQANAATYQVTVNDADVPVLAAFLADTSNTNQGTVGTSTPRGAAIPLTPSQYFTALVENFIGGLREEEKQKQLEGASKRLSNLTQEEKDFVAAYGNLTPDAQKNLSDQL